MHLNDIEDLLDLYELPALFFVRYALAVAKSIPQTYTEGRHAVEMLEMLINGTGFYIGDVHKASDAAYEMGTRDTQAAAYALNTYVLLATDPSPYPFHHGMLLTSVMETVDNAARIGNNSAQAWDNLRKYHDLFLNMLYAEYSQLELTLMKKGD